MDRSLEWATEDSNHPLQGAQYFVKSRQTAGRRELAGQPACGMLALRQSLGCANVGP